MFELAYLELARAPYSFIKKVGRVLPREVINRILRERQYFEWRGLAILMLAHSTDQRDRKYIEDSFRDSHELSLTTNLAAWATAFIEINGASAIDTIHKYYLCDPTRSEAEVRAVVTALSVHGNDGHVHLRDTIIKSYGTALNNHPEVAGLIAADLTSWKNWDYREGIAKIQLRSDIKFTTVEFRAMRTYTGSR